MAAMRKSDFVPVGGADSGKKKRDKDLRLNLVKLGIIIEMDESCFKFCHDRKLLPTTCKEELTLLNVTGKKRTDYPLFEFYHGTDGKCRGCPPYLI